MYFILGGHWMMTSCGIILPTYPTYFEIYKTQETALKHTMAVSKRFNRALTRKWNRFIRMLLLKEKYKQCEAINMGNGQRCSKLTTWEFCTPHYKILKEFCNLYHLVSKKYKFPHVDVGTLAKVEYELREKYATQFRIPTDEEHRNWMNYLQSLFITEDTVNFPDCLYGKPSEYLHVFTSSTNNYDNWRRRSTSLCKSVKCLTKESIYVFYFNEHLCKQIESDFKKLEYLNLFVNMESQY